MSSLIRITPKVLAVVLSWGLAPVLYWLLAWCALAHRLPLYHGSAQYLVGLIGFAVIPRVFKQLHHILLLLLVTGVIVSFWFLVCNGSNVVDALWPHQVMHALGQSVVVPGIPCVATAMLLTKGGLKRLAVNRAQSSKREVLLKIYIAIGCTSGITLGGANFVALKDYSYTVINAALWVCVSVCFVSFVVVVRSFEENQQNLPQEDCRKIANVQLAQILVIMIIFAIFSNLIVPQFNPVLTLLTSSHATGLSISGLGFVGWILGVTLTKIMHRKWIWTIPTVIGVIGSTILISAGMENDFFNPVLLPVQHPELILAGLFLIYPALPILMTDIVFRFTRLESSPNRALSEPLIKSVFRATAVLSLLQMLTGGIHRVAGHFGLTQQMALGVICLCSVYLLYSTLRIDK